MKARPPATTLERHALETLLPEPTVTVGDYCGFFSIEGAAARELLNFLRPHLQAGQAKL